MTVRMTPTPLRRSRDQYTVLNASAGPKVRA